MRLPQKQLVNAFGIAGSLASGIIEYLADGSWTKRMHPGWAAQSGYRAIRLALGGFEGPRTVFEGKHGLFRAFANTDDGDFEAMLESFGTQWIWQSIAFKPYACGTMAHPYIDCAREFRKKGIDAALIDRIECETAEGIVHRLWEPIDQKRSPPNGYAAKFSIPYAIAVAILRDDAGLVEFDDKLVNDADVVRLANKVNYIIDPANPYPDRFTGHVRVVLTNGEIHEYRQGFFRGGVDHPLSAADLQRKFFANCAYGGLPTTRARSAWPGSWRVVRHAGVELLRRTRARRRARMSKEPLASRVALVTGAGRNIGREIALSLAASGVAIAVNVRSSVEEGQAVVDEINAHNGHALLCVADVAEQHAVREMVAEIEGRWGRLDILVNNAAVRREAKVDDISAADWHASSRSSWTALSSVLRPRCLC